MGWLEAAVVVYLRMLYYPGGFTFPLKVMPWSVAWIEIAREAATLLMLVAVGILAGRNRLERFGYLLYAFGLWDIVYYLGLQLAIGWPGGLLTLDLLFLIPLPWVGPVLAPVLVSLAMIAACLIIALQEDRGRPLRPPILFWWLEIACGLLIIASFLAGARAAFLPDAHVRYAWGLFLPGYLGGVALLLWTWRRAEKAA